MSRIVSEGLFSGSLEVCDKRLFVDFFFVVVVRIVYASDSPIVPSSGVWNPTTDGESQKEWETDLAASVCTQKLAIIPALSGFFYRSIKWAKPSR